MLARQRRHSQTNNFAELCCRINTVFRQCICISFNFAIYIQMRPVGNYVRGIKLFEWKIRDLKFCCLSLITLSRSHFSSAPSPWTPVDSRNFDHLAAISQTRVIACKTFALHLRAKSFWILFFNWWFCDRHEAHRQRPFANRMQQTSL